MTKVIVCYHYKVTQGEYYGCNDCYREFEGNYEDALSRLMNDTLIEKFLKKFLNDDSFNSLSVSIENRNYHEAFKAAHTLKGVSLNLSLSRLSASASEITEYLRDCDNKIIDETVLFRLFDSVSKDYRMTVEVIEKL